MENIQGRQKRKSSGNLCLFQQNNEFKEIIFLFSVGQNHEKFCAFTFMAPN